MRKAAGVVVFALLAVYGCSASHEAHLRAHKPSRAEYAPNVKWHSLAEGKQVALRAKKPMVVDFAVPEHCSRCAFLQENVYNRDVIVDKINAQFVPVWVDLRKDLTAEEAELGAKYDFNNDCLLLFLNHQGQVIKDPQGEQLCFVDEIEPEVFLEYLDHVLSTYVPAG